MIRFHGGPCTPIEAAIELWTRRHALISFAYPQQVDLALRVAHSVVLDNGAFSSWESGTVIDWEEYGKWIEDYWRHPGFAFCFIPDVIDGNEKDNDDLLEWWSDKPYAVAGVPVWHMHESFERLDRLVRNYEIVAIGSSGEFSEVGTLRWWQQMSNAMAVACDADGIPRCKLHGLRQMDSTVFSHIPYSFVDSARVARSAGVDKSVPRAYRHLPPKARALVMAFDADMHGSAPRWLGTIASQKNMGF
jgi:hypothetical protein